MFVPGLWFHGLCFTLVVGPVPLHHSVLHCSTLCKLAHTPNALLLFSCSGMFSSSSPSTSGAFSSLSLLLPRCLPYLLWFECSQQASMLAVWSLTSSTVLGSSGSFRLWC